MDLADLTTEYDVARGWVRSLIDGMDAEAVVWRPHAESSAMAWHLGHTAAIEHVVLRNLTAAEPSLDPRAERVFDSAFPERQRGELPAVAQILDFREAVAERVHGTVEAIAAGRRGAPTQLGLVAATMLTALVNHEYQHGSWMAEVRETLGGAAVASPPSSRIERVDGYWLLHPRHLAG